MTQAAKGAFFSDKNIQNKGKGKEGSIKWKRICQNQSSSK